MEKRDEKTPAFEMLKSIVTAGVEADPAQGYLPPATPSRNTEELIAHLHTGIEHMADRNLTLREATWIRDVVRGLTPPPG